MRLIVAGMMAVLCGCGLFDSHVKQMDVLNGMAASASERLNDGALSSVHASGQGLNPGIEVEAAIVYRAVARYTGLAGQFSIASQGELGRDIDTDEVWAIMRDTSMTDADRRAAIERLLKPWMTPDDEAQPFTP